MKKSLIVILMLFVLVGCTKNNQAYDENLFNDGLLAVSENGTTWGYINTKGEMIIDEQFDGAGAFYDGHAIVVNDEVYQVIDRDGKLIFSVGYEYLRRNIETGLFIFEKDGLYGILDVKENIIVDPTYKLIYEYSEGYAIAITEEQLYYYIDEKGNIMNEQPYHHATPFKNGYATVKNDEQKAGLINTDFEMVIDYLHDEISVVDIYNRVVTHDKNGTLDQSDDTFDLVNIEDLSVILNNYHNIKFVTPYDMRPNTPLYQAVKDEYYELYTYDGSKFTDDEYVFIVTVGDYLITYQDAHRAPTEMFEELREYAIYNEDGELIKKASISDSRHVFQGYGNQRELYLAIDDGDFIDIYGQDDTYRIEADEVKRLSDQLIYAVKDGSYGAFNFDGEVVLDFEYDYLYEYQDGYIEFLKDDKWGIMNDKYEVIVEPMYQYLHTAFAPRVFPKL